MSAPISVVVPAYEASRYIADAVQSVLDQTLPPDEVIVVDDGSTDGTADVVGRLSARVRVVSTPHQGYASAMNRGVVESGGELLAFQDADDLWLPDRLERQALALEADATLDIVFGHFEVFLSPDLPPEHARRYRVPPVMPSYQFPSMLIRRNTFDRVGPVDSGVGTGATFDWISRARHLGLRTLVLPGIVSRRRIHGSNMSIRLSDRRELVAVLRAHRRRITSAEHGEVT